MAMETWPERAGSTFLQRTSTSDPQRNMSPSRSCLPPGRRRSCPHCHRSWPIRNSFRECWGGSGGSNSHGRTPRSGSHSGCPTRSHRRAGARGLRHRTPSESYRGQTMERKLSRKPSLRLRQGWAASWGQSNSGVRRPGSGQARCCAPGTPSRGGSPHTPWVTHRPRTTLRCPRKMRGGTGCGPPELLSGPPRAGHRTRRGWRGLRGRRTQTLRALGSHLPEVGLDARKLVSSARRSLSSIQTGESTIYEPLGKAQIRFLPSVLGCPSCVRRAQTGEPVISLP